MRMQKKHLVSKIKVEIQNSGVVELVNTFGIRLYLVLNFFGLFFQGDAPYLFYTYMWTLS